MYMYHLHSTSWRNHCLSIFPLQPFIENLCHTGVFVCIGQRGRASNLVRAWEYMSAQPCFILSFHSSITTYTEKNHQTLHKSLLGKSTYSVTFFKSFKTSCKSSSRFKISPEKNSHYTFSNFVKKTDRNFSRSIIIINHMTGLKTTKSRSSGPVSL